MQSTCLPVFRTKRVNQQQLKFAYLDIWEICLFVWFDSLCPINNFSAIKEQVFLGWTSTKLGSMCLIWIMLSCVFIIVFCTWMMICLLVWLDSLRPINYLSVTLGWVLLSLTSIKLGLMCLAQGHNTLWWGLNSRPICLESSTLALNHCALYTWMMISAVNIQGW